MPSRPWYPRYMADYIAKTRWFTSAAQHGIYSCLLDVYYLEGEALPADRPAELRAMCTATQEEWGRYAQEILDRLFVRRDDFYHNKRADEEIDKFNRRQTKRSKSARNAAETRWARERSAEPAAVPKSDQYAEARTAIELYNVAAEQIGLKRCQKIDTPRLKKIKGRLSECGGLDGWKVALEKLGASDFLRGNGGRGWKANLDFMAQASSFTKMMEGAYDNNGARPAASRGVRSRESLMEGVLRGVGVGELDLGGAAAPDDRAPSEEAEGGTDANRGRRRAGHG